MRDNISSSFSVTTTTATTATKATTSHVANTFKSGASSSFSTPPPPITPSPPPPLTPFELTNLSLLKLGSLPMDRFIQNDPSEELEGFDIPLVDPANPYSYSLNRRPGEEEDVSGDWEDEVRNVPESESARYLRSVVHRIFGNNANMAAGAGKDILRYEFLDEQGENRKCCILTIVRPNGSSRSYRTKPEFSRKSDAKLVAASLALRMGAVSFLRWGEESQRMKLARLDAKASEKRDDEASRGGASGDDAVAEGERAILQIENCCTEWRAGSVIPQWIYITEPRQQNAFGCAVKITLSPHIQKTYSVLVSPDYPRKSLSKAACAKLAVEEGILEFIKHGDGLERPMESLPGGGIVGGGEGTLPIPSGPMTLQAFHAALPKPMPDEIGTKSNGEINAVSWLNNMVQFAKGSRMTVAFHWHTDVKVGLHGCLLRLSRPDAHSQSYLVDAIFSKRGDAKLAVCLYACSQGLGNFIRRVVAEIDARLTPPMRRQCMEEYMPQLGQALNRIKHGLKPEYQFSCDLATFGCTMIIELPSPDVPLASPAPATTTDGDASQSKPAATESECAGSTAPTQSETPSPSVGPIIRREWKVPLAYKSKADARVAVICLAMEDGLMDFVRSRGKSEKERREKEKGGLNAEEARARTRALESMRRGRGGSTFGAGGRGRGRGGFGARGGFGGGMGRGGFNGTPGMGMGIGMGMGMGMGMGPMPFAPFGGAMPVMPPHMGVGMGVGGMASFMGMGMGPYYPFGGAPTSYGGMPFNSGYNTPQVPATNSYQQPGSYPPFAGSQSRLAPSAPYPGRPAGTNGGALPYGSLAGNSPSHSVSSYSSGSGKPPPTGPRGWKERQIDKERGGAQDRNGDRDSDKERMRDEHERIRVKETDQDRGHVEQSETEEEVEDGEESSTSKEETKPPPSPSGPLKKISPAPKPALERKVTRAPEPVTPEPTPVKSKADAKELSEKHKDSWPVGLMDDIDAKLSSVISRLEKEIEHDEARGHPSESGRGGSRGRARGRSVDAKPVYRSRSTSRSYAPSTRGLKRSRSVGTMLDEEEPGAKRLREKSASRGRSRGRPRGSTSRGRSTSVSLSSGRAVSKARSVVNETGGEEQRESGGDEVPEEGEIISAVKKRKASKKQAAVRMVPAETVDELPKKTRTKRKRGVETDAEGEESAVSKKEKKEKRKRDAEEGEVEEKKKSEKPRSKKEMSLVDETGKPYLTSLYEYCTEHDLSRPQLFHETGHSDPARGITDGSGVRVWLVLGKEKMEHSQVFPSFEAGKQRLARSVLARLKGKKATSS